LSSLILNEHELFDLLINVREFSRLWYKRRTEKLTKDEKERMKKAFQYIVKNVKILPFKGKI